MFVKILSGVAVFAVGLFFTLGVRDYLTLPLAYVDGGKCVAVEDAQGIISVCYKKPERYHVVMVAPGTTLRDIISHRR